MSKFRMVASGLTFLTALLGVLAGIGLVSAWAVAVSGVCMGLWWGFGKTFMPKIDDERAAYREAREERRAGR